MFTKRTTHPAAKPGPSSASPAAHHLMVAFGSLLLLAATGCWRQQDPETGIAGLERFESPEALKAYLAEQVDRPWRSVGGPAVFLPVLMSGPDMGVASSAPLDGGEAEYSTTNLQEEGVDESDVVKNDATYLYILGTDRLRIVRAVPADNMEISATLELPGRPAALYLQGDKLIALNQGTSYDTTVVAIIDITDRSAPAIEATIELDGGLATSRLIDSKLHLVLQLMPALPEGGNSPAIRSAEIDDLLPDAAVSLAGQEPKKRNLVEWQDFYRPIDPDGYSVTALVTLDLEDPEAPPKSAGVIADAGTIYASRQAIYLTDWGYDFRGELRDTTDIYKFDLTAEGPVPTAAGSVPGRLLNRFSLGEHEGYLRAATTVLDPSVEAPNPVSNGVYVLAPEDGQLKIVGLVEGIAPGESIFSARFLGERGFLVTFVRVDPLFTLDLSDPTSPRVIGELKVPGYSDYIHPLGKNHLLTIGKDAIDTGDPSLFQGVQISIFDVTDFAHPKQLDVEITGGRGTESEALDDPHAFNYFDPAGMLAVPMNVVEGAGAEPWMMGNPTFRGLCLYDISTDTGIEPAGRISTGLPDSPYYWQDYRWTRGIFIGDHVYAVTSLTVQALALDNLGGAPHELLLETGD